MTGTHDTDDIEEALRQICIGLGILPWAPAGWAQWFAAAASGEWA